MNAKLIGLTTESINFTNNSFRKEIKGMFPVGTMVEIDQDEMEANPGFFHISLEGTDGTSSTQRTAQTISKPQL